MMPIKTARELMVRNLVTLSPEMDVTEAFDVLLRHRISGAPVVDADRKFLGTFSEKSCMRYILDSTYEGLPSTPLMALVDQAPPTVDIETDLLSITQTFLDAACRRLPVLDKSGRLLGQISRRDVMGVFRDYMKSSDRVPANVGLYVSGLHSADERRV